MNYAPLGGMAAGLGVALGIYGVIPKRRSMAAILFADPDASQEKAGGLESARELVGRELAAYYSRRGKLEGLEADLAILNETYSEAMAKAVSEAAMLAGIFGGLWLVIALLVLRNGLTIGPVSVNALVFIPILIVVTFVLGLLGGLDSLHRRADKTRDDYHRGLSAFLLLVSQSISGGSGLESAVQRAGLAVQSPIFARLVEAFRGGYRRGENLWDTLEELGLSWGINDLVDIASTMRLQGTSGGSIKEGLLAKAEAMRAADLAHLERASLNAVIKLPVIGLIGEMGFTLFILYPAGVRILQSMH